VYIGRMVGGRIFSDPWGYDEWHGK
jgi:hypothetical protein